MLAKTFKHMFNWFTDLGTELAFAEHVRNKEPKQVYVQSGFWLSDLGIYEQSCDSGHVYFF